VFVLNNDQRKWLTGDQMNLAESKVYLTSLWADSIYKSVKVTKKEVFGIDNNHPVMLFVGRLSKEKGVLELPNILKSVRQAFPEVVLVVVGEGPATEQLKKVLPDSVFFKWAAQERLPAIYSAADILVFPSKFDTFSRTSLESLSCSLPVISYNTKGTKDIIRNGECGFLVNTQEQMCEKIIEYLSNPQQQNDFRVAALECAKNYNRDCIVEQFVSNVWESCEKK
ncbi:MAG: glycosyltransferase family 4 protein, partial [Tannerella sp.]|nr:glycosyltransferase family 4 protein [Tannerella sp.]